MKIKNNWINLTEIKIESGIERAFKLSEYKKGRIFRINDNIERLDQIVFSQDPEYYIIYKISKDIEVEGKDAELHISYISLNDYFILEFHSILDDKNLDWQEKPEMVRDLSTEISDLFSSHKKNK